MQNSKCELTNKVLCEILEVMNKIEVFYEAIVISMEKILRQEEKNSKGKAIRRVRKNL